MGCLPFAFWLCWSRDRRYLRPSLHGVQESQDLSSRWNPKNPYFATPQQLVNSWSVSSRAPLNKLVIWRKHYHITKGFNEYDPQTEQYSISKIFNFRSWEILKLVMNREAYLSVTSVWRWDLGGASIQQSSCRMKSLNKEPGHESCLASAWLKVRSWPRLLMHSFRAEGRGLETPHQSLPWGEGRPI